MPTYAYRCTECGHEFDIYQSFSEDSLTDCPECAGRLRKLLSPVGVVFKGSGFYRNDSRAAEKSKGKSKSSVGSGSSSSGSSSSGSSNSDSSGSGASGSGSNGSGSKGSGSSGSSNSGASSSGTSASPAASAPAKAASTSS